MASGFSFFDGSSSGGGSSSHSGSVVQPQCDSCRGGQGGEELRSMPSCPHQLCLRCFQASQVSLAGCPSCLRLPITTTSSTPYPLGDLLPPHLSPASLSLDTSLLLGNLLEATAISSPADVPSHRADQGDANRFRFQAETASNSSYSAAFRLPPSSHLDLHQPTCTSCSENTAAVVRCEECEENLCSSCVEAHLRVRLTKDHHIRDLGLTFPNPIASPQSQFRFQPPPSGTEIVFCAVHPGEMCYMACENCAQQLCGTCIVRDRKHDKHRVRFTIRGDNGSNDGTNRQVTEARLLCRSLEESSEAVARMSERIESRVVSIANEVKAMWHHYVSALEERKRFLLQRLEMIRTAKLESLATQREELNRVLLALRDSIGGLEANGATAEAELTRQMASLAGMRPLLVPQEDDQLIFQGADSSLMGALRSLGHILTTAYPPQCVVVGSPGRGVTNKLAYFSIQARDHCGESCLAGGDTFVAVVRTPTGAIEAAEVQDKHDGTYVVCFRPEMEGEYAIRVILRGRSIRGSPMTFRVRTGRDYSGVAMQPAFSFGCEGTGDGQLCRPWGICVDRTSRVIVADRSNNRIQIFSPDGTFLLKFGSTGCRSGQFDRPAGVTVNSKNQIVVADKDNHRVQIFTAEGQFLVKFGDKGRAAGQFNYPWDVATNSADEIAVSDTRNHRIQLFSPSGVFLRKFSLENSLYKNFDSPRGLVFNSDGNLIVTDFNNHRLALVTLADGGAALQFFGREGEWEGTFKRPQGLDVDLEGNILVADSRNNRVQIFSPSLTFVATLGVEGQGSKVRSIMDRPCDVAVAPDGRIYVVDFGNNMVRVF